MTEFVKHDQDKPRFGLVPAEALEAIARVMTYGAKKYADHNWRKATAWSRYYDAALRHLNAWNKGEDNDPETGENHLAHAGCCVMMLLSLVDTKCGDDDRWRDDRLFSKEILENALLPRDEWAESHKGHAIQSVKQAALDGSEVTMLVCTDCQQSYFTSVKEAVKSLR